MLIANTLMTARTLGVGDNIGFRAGDLTVTLA
jgi:hypothetical protein